ncbi:Transcriptional regulator xre family [Methanonatronarchaeum thermophilum]|uniref:Transcriptional regulator xre family n=1 Tax=Methanonatronarchaeum thermophilum TaxID=1927129 RepID=A0A1Y3GDB3_9EURY|nr:hypothetical protein [Methanonatronarchaeum thermophilum]OUJ18303.1 Transcriptional regulator xre family [Methanonatronarchaeum thermophilum]
MKSEDGMTPSIEVDIAAVTNEEKVLFFEVTSQRNGAISILPKKRKKFDDNYIHYDMLLQLSLDNQSKPVPFDDNV